MINGTYSVGRVVEESYCRSSKDYTFTEIGIYKIHSTALMPKIPFGEAQSTPQPIEKSIFLNAKETKLSVATTINTQNFLSTKYVGRAPLEFYPSGGKTNKGRQFILICREGIPTESYRVFGTKDAIHGYNKDANDLTKLPDGGD